MTPKQQKQLNISYLGSNFQEWFNGMEIKPKKCKLFEKVLERPMNDKEILAEFKPTEIELDEFFGNFCNLNKSEWYIGYVKDKNNELRAVSVRWYVDGWGVDAISVAIPVVWYDGSRVFSRDSFDTLTPSSLDTLEKRVKSLEDKLNKIKELL